MNHTCFALDTTSILSSVLVRVLAPELAVKASVAVTAATTAIAGSEADEASRESFGELPPRGSSANMLAFRAVAESPPLPPKARTPTPRVTFSS